MVNKSKSHRFRAVPINEVLEKHLIELKDKAIKGQVYVFEHEGGGEAGKMERHIAAHFAAQPAAHPLDLFQGLAPFPDRDCSWLSFRKDVTEREAFFLDRFQCFFRQTNE